MAVKLKHYLFTMFLAAHNINIIPFALSKVNGRVCFIYLIRLGKSLDIVQTFGHLEHFDKSLSTFKQLEYSFITKDLHSSLHPIGHSILVFFLFLT